MLALPHFWKAMEFLNNYGRNKQVDQKLETTVVIVRKHTYSGGTQEYLYWRERDGLLKTFAPVNWKNHSWMEVSARLS